MVHNYALLPQSELEVAQHESVVSERLLSAQYDDMAAQLFGERDQQQQGILLRNETFPSVVDK